MLLVALLVLQTPTTIDQIDVLLKGRNFDALRQLLAPSPKGQRDPFRILQAGGAYDVGRFGWSATEVPPLKSGEGLVVIGTKLTSEDIGELVFQRVGEKLKFIPEAETLGVNVDRHSFVVKFHPETKGVDITDRIRFRSSTSNSQFLFRMSPQYVVDQVTDKSGNSVKFSQSQGVVLLEKPSTPSFEYSVHYTATVDLPDYAGSISEKEATLTNDYWYPMIARGPAPFDIEVHAPVGWTPVAQGEKVAVTHSPDEEVAKYRMDLPVTYYSVSAAPYKTFSNVIEGRRFSMWSLRMSPEAMKAQTELYAPIIKFYEQFSPFPFSGYGAVDSAVYGGGALEAYSFATYGGGLPSEDAHEPSHTWWGGIMDNTYLHSFWNESFAVFCEGLYHRNVPLGNVSERRLAFVQTAAGAPEYDDVAIINGGVDAGSVSGSLGYGKGARVLQMLEQLMGTPKMIRTMHDWIAVHKKGTPAEWPEFESVAIKDSPSLRLGSFFSDWIDRPGYAKFSAKVRYQNSATQIDLNWKGKRFRMPLLILTRSKNGLDSYHLVDTLAGDHFKFAGPKPALVSVDPFRQALREMGPDEVPIQLDSMQTLKTLVDPTHTDWAARSGGDAAESKVTPELSGLRIIGSPESLPWLKPLCDQVGLQVHGNRLSYKGTTIDLNHGSAQAVVDLPNGKHCTLVMGKTRIPADVGRARLAVTDDLGRFLRGVTEPKVKGNLTYRL